MKAALTDLGVLVITPETPIETFALRKWNEQALCGSHTVKNADETVGETFTLLRGANFIVNGNPT